MCGDYYSFSTNSSSISGSPLHVRGLHFPYLSFLFCFRITPACAGTTYRQRRVSKRVKDHPCICGDYVANKATNLDKQGSPLHVRGLQYNGIINCFLIRITPACAGTTITHRYSICCYQDHPCMCGDYFVILFNRFWSSGSPLHVRGLLPIFDIHVNYFGITPACAGTTMAL